MTLLLHIIHHIRLEALLHTSKVETSTRCPEMSERFSWTVSAARYGVSDQELTATSRSSSSVTGRIVLHPPIRHLNNRCDPCFIQEEPQEGRITTYSNGSIGTTTRSAGTRRVRINNRWRDHTANVDRRHL